MAPGRERRHHPAGWEWSMTPAESVGYDPRHALPGAVRVGGPAASERFARRRGSCRPTPRSGYAPVIAV